MAKQIGNNQWLGKVDGRRYYAMKGVEGTVSSKINAGMSSRVKNDAAYANTRLNNSEFGGGGSFAGLVVRLISKRWRTILKAFTVGNVQKIVMSMVHEDTTSPWGSRQLVGTTWQGRLRGALNAFAKIDFADNFAQPITAEYDAEDGISVAGTTTAQTSSALLARGAEGVVYEYYKHTAKYGPFDEVGKKFGVPDGAVEFLGSKDAEIGQVVDLSGSYAVEDLPEEATGQMTSLLVVALPYKVVANVKHTLQELCSFSLINIDVTE